MREILFRGKRLDNKQWIYGGYDTDWGLSVEDRERHWIVPAYYNSELVKEETVCIFTGLLDKDGNKIFENDIISSNNNTFVVIWLEDKAKFVCKFTDGTDIYCDLSDKYIKDFFVVVGNIYDTPDLISK